MRPPLRFLTCGSVDDGKSTLLGRLLYEQNLILEDHLAALERDSRYGTSGPEVDFMATGASGSELAVLLVDARAKPPPHVVVHGSLATAHTGLVSCPRGISSASPG